MGRFNKLLITVALFVSLVLSIAILPDSAIAENYICTSTGVRATVNGPGVGISLWEYMTLLI